MSVSPSITSLRDSFIADSARIEREFAATSDGRKAIQERSAQVDRLAIELSNAILGADISQVTLVAIGGYGRRELFPFSDIDLLYLCEDDATLKRHRGPMRLISQMLWDMRLRLSPAYRLISECDTFTRDNPEFAVSLLDQRFLAGDRGLFDRLHHDALPRLLARCGSDLLRDISQLTKERHVKEGDTIFHLEPNVKNSPGGLRDYHTSCWVAMLLHPHRIADWATPENLWPPQRRDEMHNAFDFLAAARCFVHYTHGRYDNGLSYELQAAAAARGVGVEAGGALEPADWMRIYFRHARAVHSLSTQLLDEALPTPTTFLTRLEGWRTRRANPDPGASIGVINGRLVVNQPELVRDLDRLLALFLSVAQDGWKLSRETEELIIKALPSAAPSAGHISGLWEKFRQILTAPHAPDALRAMHSSGLLVKLFPEFAAIDALVIRDFYHHYTVDAHSFIAIENIQRLREPENDWQRRFAGIFSELEQPELLLLSLLFHDVGKGMAGDDHVTAGLQAIEGVLERLRLDAEDADTVRFLIREHLQMSMNLLRRDIFDPQTIRAFAEKVGSLERLKLLTLFTYADIRAVNPEALTPWKAESLIQFYVSTANYMSRSLDEERFHAAVQDEHIERILKVFSRSASGSETMQELAAFLEGLPRRYVLAYTPEEIATHFQMARDLQNKDVQLRLGRRGHWFRLVIVTTDRRYLFSRISGVLAAWGMNIWKAEAFGNASGVVVDTFHFSDPNHTLELNPSEIERLEENIVSVISGRTPLEELLRGRTSAQALRPPKIAVATEVRFDDSSSSHSTLMEIATRDRPGLLYHLSAAMARAGCNIEVALIDTEGQRAVDAFYLTAQGNKLDAEQQQKLRDALLAAD